MFLSQRYIRAVAAIGESPAVKARLAHAVQSRGTEISKGHKPL